MRGEDELCMVCIDGGILHHLDQMPCQQRVHTGFDLVYYQNRPGFQSGKPHTDARYIRPQENGSHYDCEYVELNNSRYGIVASAEKAFSFNASYYTQEELEKKTHNYELIESDSVVFCVDYALNGIGSNSCGPVVLEQYRFDDVLFRFQFTLIPYVKG